MHKTIPSHYSPLIAPTSYSVGITLLDVIDILHESTFGVTSLSHDNFLMWFMDKHDTEWAACSVIGDGVLIRFKGKEIFFEFFAPGAPTFTVGETRHVIKDLTDDLIICDIIEGYLLGLLPFEEISEMASLLNFICERSTIKIL